MTDNTAKVALTEAELWQVINSLSQAPAEDDVDFESAEGKLSAAWARLKARNANG